MFKAFVALFIVFVPPISYDMFNTKKHNSLYVFTADWCKPCHECKKEINSLLSDKQPVKMNILKADITYINIDDNQAMIQKYGITLIPSYVILDPDGKVLTTCKSYLASGDTVEAKLKKIEPYFRE